MIVMVGKSLLSLLNVYAVFLCMIEHVLVELIFGQAPLAYVAVAHVGKFSFASITCEQHLGPLVEMLDVCRMECKMIARMAR